MKNLIKKILRPFVPPELRILRRKQLGGKQLKIWRKYGLSISPALIEWQRNGCPIPPPHFVKQLVIQEYQKKSGYTTLVETGTFLGDMVEVQKARFKKVISIELGVELFERAKDRFINDKNVTIVQGDSGKVLPEVLKDINEPSIFWLDGHYSAGLTAKGDKMCPIFEEVKAIFGNKRLNHILLIDDARCFNGRDDYPTVKILTEYIKKNDEKYQVEVKHDIIRYMV